MGELELTSGESKEVEVSSPLVLYSPFSENGSTRDVEGFQLEYWGTAERARPSIRRRGFISCSDAPISTSAPQITGLPRQDAVPHISVEL